MNPRSAPSRIGEAHFVDQINDLMRYRRSTQRMAALPSPAQSESLPVPGDDSFGLNYRQCGFPAAPETREPDPHQSISTPQKETMAAIGSLENQKLMPQSKNLGLQCYAGSKSLTNRRKQQENGREHGLSKLSWQRFKFNWVNEYRVFGRDSIYLAPTETVLSTVDLVFGLESTNFR